MALHKKLLRILGSILLIAVLALVSLRFFPKGSLFLTATNFDPESRLVAYTVPSLDFTFSQDIDPNFKEEDFVISPAVEGRVSVNKNQISYVLAQELIMDKTYEITIKNLTSKDQKSSLNALRFTITAIDIPTVTKIIPEGEVQNLQQDITVFFSSPMVALGVLDTMKEDCPLRIEPALEGECKWISTSIVQFRPKKLNGATKYDITVVKSPNMLFDIQEFSGSFQTPALEFRTKVQDGKLIVESNFPVDKKLLESHLHLFVGNSQKELPVQLEQLDEGTFSLSSPDLQYTSLGVGYRIFIDEGMVSKGGNIQASRGEYLQSFDLLDGSYSFVDVSSSTGAYLSTQYITSLDSRGKSFYGDVPDVLNIAPKGTFIVLDFQNEQALNKQFFQLVDGKGKQVSFSLAYVVEDSWSQEENKYVQQTNKHKVKVIFNSPVNADQTELKLIIKKGIDSFLKEDYEIPLKLLPALKYTRDPQLVNNRKVCFYTNYPLYETWERGGQQQPSPAKYFSTLPVSRNISTSSYDWEGWYGGDESARCPEAKQGEYLTVLTTKLNPNANYELIVNGGLMDIYGQTLAKTGTRNLQTKAASEGDKQIFGPKYINTYPGGVPIVSSW